MLTVTWYCSGNLKMNLPDQPDNGVLKSGWPWEGRVDAAIYNTQAQWPKITIITPSFNQGKYIEETIRSIVLQNYPNLEYIIIDGGSTDETVDIINKYSAFITDWVSEKDEGQAHAINKGLKKATGDIVNWINSDDYLAPDALYHIASKYSSGFDMLAGCVNNFNDNIAIAVDGYSGTIKNKDLSLLNYFHTGSFYYHQPGVWFKRSLLNQISLNQELHYCFDTQLMLKILETNPIIVYCDEVLVNFRLHDESKTVASNKKFLTEFRQVHHSYTSCKDPVIAAHAKRFLADRDWREYLNTLQASQQSKLKKTIGIITAIANNPYRRLNRFSMGALKNVILS